MTGVGWPDPNPRVGESFAEDSPTGDRWQNSLKGMLYPFLLPLQTRLNRARLGVGVLRAPLTWGSRGAEFDYVISRLGKARIEAKRLLMQGAGDGKEFRFWEPYSPAHLVGADLFPTPLKYTPLQTVASFAAADLATLPFLPATFDGAASMNTWEHIKQPEAVLAETQRVVKSGGWLLATFGPLYTAMGGDHLCYIRGGLEHGYNHLLLDPETYSDFIEHMTVIGLDVVDGSASPRAGLLYIQLDLFSHLGWREYRQVFSEYLDLDIFAAHVDPRAIEFRDQFPDKWSAILDKGHAEEDLLVSSITVLGRFKQRVAEDLGTERVKSAE